MFKKYFILFICFIFIYSCKTTTDGTSTAKESTVDDSLIGKYLDIELTGVGIGESSNSRLSQKKAQSNSLLDLSEQVDELATEIFKSFCDENDYNYDSTQKIHFAQRLNGTRIIKKDFSDDGVILVITISVDKALRSVVLNIMSDKKLSEEDEKIYTQFANKLREELSVLDN